LRVPGTRSALFERIGPIWFWHPGIYLHIIPPMPISLHRKVMFRRRSHRLHITILRF